MKHELYVMLHLERMKCTGIASRNALQGTFRKPNPNSNADLCNNLWEKKNTDYC